MLKIRRLRNVQDLAAFAAAYRRHSGYDVPLDYLAGALVFAAGSGTAMTCGFVLGINPPFRTLTRIPEPERSRCEAEIDPADTQEFACVWMERALRKSWRSYLFWWELLRQGGKANRRGVLMGTEVPALRDFYESGRPRPLYSGPVVVDGIEKTGWVYATTIDQRYIGIVRMVRHKLFGRRRPAATSPRSAETSLPTETSGEMGTALTAETSLAPEAVQP